ncbi:MAG: hypothetical protein JO301_10165 [Chitinophagaceae bacterium]|nr:hypothetical protein [Chitinophagaceae bacterium]
MKTRFFLLFIIIANIGYAQLDRDQIHSDFVLYQRRLDFDRNMRNRTINAVFAQPLDSNTEEKYREACWAISQFLLRSPEIEHGFQTMFNQYGQMEDATRRALLEAVYGTYHSEYKNRYDALIRTERSPRLFAMQAGYLYRLDNSKNGVERLRGMLITRFPDYQQNVLLQQLDNYLLNHASQITVPRPGLQALFDYRKASGQKTIYSFQRWNRDYPGLAVIQNADGSFARDSAGKLLVFQQLARSASDLPYFITDGSTPQGIFSIQGTEVSHNNLIGPTPNIQLVMPNETDSLFWHGPYDSTQTPLVNYLNLLPDSWRSYAPMTESFYAGKIGRTEIIAHGTTMDPDYFKDMPFYPLTPTMGCLCAKESWNMFTGKIVQSDQFRLADTFLATPGTTGYLFVINLDNQQTAVTSAEIEKLIGQN